MKYYIKSFLQRMITILVFPLRLFPIRKNRILFLSLEGGSSCEYSCNPRYLCEYILENAPGQYELVWLFRHPADYTDLKEKGIRIGKHFTVKGFYYCLTSRFIVTNGGYLTWFPFRKKQIRINTWHGGGVYKKLENDRSGANRATLRRMEYCNRNTTVFISSSELFTRQVIRKAFRFRGDVLPVGMPRNDILFSLSSSDWYRKIREKYQLPSNSRIVLYAPTFREDSSAWDVLPADQVLSHLKESTGEDWYLLFRSHLKMTHSDLLAESSHCIDVHDYPDTQHLLCASDLLITDYSSIVWDFCLTERPALLFTPDLENYLKVQGFYRDIHKWGFPVCHDSSELIAACNTVMTDSGMNGSIRHQMLLGSYETGEACRKILEYIQHH